MKVLFTLLSLLGTLIVLSLPALGTPTPAQRYLHLKNRIQSDILPASRLADMQTDPDGYYGQVVEACGKVVGAATTGNTRLLILQIGNVSVDVDVPHALSASSPWLDTGNVLRVLVQAPRSSAGPNSLRLIASAPENDVTQLEREIANSSGAGRFSRGFEPGRAATYSMDGRAQVYRGSGNCWDDPHYLNPYAMFIAARNPRLSINQAYSIAHDILEDSCDANIDPRLIVAMMIAESDFNPDATSRTGAMGLGQLMPGTASGLGVTNAYDPHQNIAAAVHILSGNADKYGGHPEGIVSLNTLMLTMAAYNAGSGAVHKYHGIPPYRETQNYVRRVASLYRQLCADDRRVADR